MNNYQCIPVKDAIKVAGSISGLSRLIGVSRTQIHKWVNEDWPVTELFSRRLRETPEWQLALARGVVDDDFLLAQY